MYVYCKFSTLPPIFSLLYISLTSLKYWKRQHNFTLAKGLMYKSPSRGEVIFAFDLQKCE